VLHVADRETVTTVYGMPSSHAQFVSFFAVFLVLFLVIRYFHCVVDFILLTGYAVSKLIVLSK